jgi:putative ABC transport system permease protein
MSSLASWRLALRLARRDALRSRGRSVLVLVMIALPVLAVTAADVVIQTQSVSSVEGLDRRLGSAAAQVVVPAEGRPMLQSFDPYDGNTSHGRRQDPPTADEVSAALGGARLIPEVVGGVDVRTDKGYAWSETTQVDLRDPIAGGLAELTSGRLPQDAGEVVVNQALLDKGYAVGDRLDLRGKDKPSPLIVGVAESPDLRDAPFAAGPVGSLGPGDLGYPAGPAWLAAGGPVSWQAVEKLNTMGATVLSREVIENPPPPSEIPDEIRAWSSGTDDAYIAAVALIVVMALLEVVLLAGPAFAVSARRQSRSLALMAASGGTPAQSRRVVLAGGVVLGGVAAVLGVGLGIGAGRLLVPVVQRWSSTWFGPFDVPWLHLLGIASFGLASAVLAAVVPAVIASRQDVVAVLAGRRADRPPSVRSPFAGLILLAAAVAAAAYGATAGATGEFFIAGAAILAVLGMLFIVPVVVVGVARVAGRLPLAARYAARDAARHRTRTVPAVAAVAATVAGVVALGIAVTSDEAENKGTYSPTLAMGQASVTASDLGPAKWAQLEAVVRRELPGAGVVPVVGTVERGRRVQLAAPGRRGPLLESMTVNFGSSMLVADSVPAVVPGLSASDRERADEVLARGGVVGFADDRVDADTAVVRRGRERVTVPAAYVRFADGPYPPLAAILAPAVADRVGAETMTGALAVAGTDISTGQQENVSEAVSAISRNAGFYVERGYQSDQGTIIVQLVLAGLGAVLMLGGTLTATFLALSDARPDLATLSAVGASPRRRRGIAASYALVVGFVGAVLGAAVGFIPGLAITVPLTAPAYSDTGPYVDVPWLLVLGLVVGLPLVTALIVGLSTRSRLPLVARLD